MHLRHISTMNLNRKADHIVSWRHTRLAFIFYVFQRLSFLELEKPYLIYISHVWRYYINAPPTWHTKIVCFFLYDFPSVTTKSTSEMCDRLCRIYCLEYVAQ